MSEPLTRRGLFGWLGAALGAGAGLWLRAGDAGAAPGAALLRPPGALDELDFLGACLRCGQCVEVCPPGALRLADLGEGLAAGTPYALTRETSCTLCAGQDELRCIATCPTAALSPVADERAVRMGVAVIDRGLCLSWQGTVCRACWHACPFPNEAITLDWKTRPTVVAEACVGCGLCVHACLTEPSSLRVVPRAEFEPGSPTHAGEGALPF